MTEPNYIYEIGMKPKDGEVVFVSIERDRLLNPTMDKELILEAFREINKLMKGQK